jgi:hypothetical protein
VGLKSQIEQFSAAAEGKDGLQEQVFPQGTQDCRIRIIRPSGWVDRLRSYKIRVNGAEAGRLAVNSILDLRVPPGVVSIEARNDWGRSRTLVVNAMPERPINVEVSNHWGTFHGIWGATFGRSSYLILKEVS